MSELEEGYDDWRLGEWMFEQLEKSKALRKMALEELGN
jgi:hypothetical protein